MRYSKVHSALYIRISGHSKAGGHYDDVHVFFLFFLSIITFFRLETWETGKNLALARWIFVFASHAHPVDFANLAQLLGLTPKNMPRIFLIESER